MLKGAFTAVVTPFDKNDQFNEEGFRQNLRFQIKNGIDGIVVLGTTGESPTIDTEERKKIIETAVQELKGKARLLVGTGSNSTKQTIANTLQAQELGADAALVITPYYNKPTQEGLFQHYTALSQVTSLPIIVYNAQGRTGLNMLTDTLMRLVDNPKIIGVKDSSYNIFQINEIVELIGSRHPQFSILTGDDPMTLPAMSLGCHGVISVVSNLAPAAVRNLAHAALTGDYEEARKWHYLLMPFYKAAFIETNPIPIKAAMEMCGMAAGHTRMPLCEMTPENKKMLQQVIQAMPKEWYGKS